jgi:uncharacterized protein (AIM24 family)
LNLNVSVNGNGQLSFEQNNGYKYQYVLSGNGNVAFASPGQFATFEFTQSQSLSGTYTVQAGMCLQLDGNLSSNATVDIYSAAGAGGSVAFNWNGPGICGASFVGLGTANSWLNNDNPNSVISVPNQSGSLLDGPGIT